MDTSAIDFCKQRHKKYFIRCLQVLPQRYVSLDTTRMTIAFFSLSGLDLLRADDILEKDKDKITQFIYALQIKPSPDDNNLHLCGFRGSTSNGSCFDNEALNASIYDSSHVTMTYTSLLSLLILGDDLSGVNRRGVIAGLKHLQHTDGSKSLVSMFTSFFATPDACENDMRFVYCACCVSYIMDDWSGVNIDKAVSFIKSSQSYEGSFAQGPGLEGHGGSTFCAVASLVLMQRLESALDGKAMSRLRRWCLLRQQTGFQGRPNKPVDTCYSFWVGATLKLLGIQQFSNKEFNRAYLMEAQDQVVGGLSKWPSTTPDPMHSYLGLCGLSLIGEPELHELDPALNVSTRVTDRLKEIHTRWRFEADGTDQLCTKSNENSIESSNVQITIPQNRIKPEVS